MHDEHQDRGDVAEERGTRTPAWYSSRFLLVVGIGLLLSAVLLVWLMPRPFHEDMITLGPLWLPSWIVVTVAASVCAVLGLVWMIRILRGPRDEPPPPWRYRDR